MTDITVQDVPAVERTVRLAATGDEAAFTRLVEQHHAAMARVAYVIVGDVDLARDAVQAAWAIAWRRLGSLRDASQVRPWLVGVPAPVARAAGIDLSPTR